MMTWSGKGIVVPLVTPFDSDGRFAPQAMRDLVDRVVGNGASGVMPTGLTGEGPLLKTSETLTVWESTFACVASRVPVLPAIFTTTTRQAVELASHAESFGAAGILAAPILPELYSGRSLDDVERFYKSICKHITCPLILFNYPTFTGFDLTPESVQRLAAIEQVTYVKESSADSKRVHGIKRLCGERVEVICGAPQVALECFALGCRSWITGLLNVIPALGCELLCACGAKSNLAKARRIYFDLVLPLAELLEVTLNPMGVIKAALRAQGIEVGAPRPPGASLSSKHNGPLQAVLNEIPRIKRVSNE